METLEVLNPVALVTARKSRLAQRPSTLSNKRVALYWNGKPGGEVALARVGELLDERFENLQLTLIKSSVGGFRARLEDAKAFDAVVASTGD